MIPLPGRSLLPVAALLVTSCATSASPPATFPASKVQPTPQYVTTRSATDPHFVTSVERMGKCEIKGDAVLGSGFRVPYQLYPLESVAKHEEGTVVVQLIFDPDWCVRKAIVIKSSGYWRLDEVSVDYVMTFKWIPTKPVMIGGESTVEIPIAWGASQAKK
jgi:TonB family protein